MAKKDDGKGDKPFLLPPASDESFDQRVARLVDIATRALRKRREEIERKDGKSH